MTDPGSKAPTSETERHSTHNTAMGRHTEEAKARSGEVDGEIDESTELPLLPPLPDDTREKKVRMGLESAGFTVGEPPREEWRLVPPDGGWGWLVLAGAMLVNILVPGTVKSFGVLFVEFLEVFDAGPAAAAWIPALCYFLYSSLGPLSSILSVKYSYRTVTILGGGFAAVGMILSCWADSVSYLYFSYGILVGTGAGLAFPPTVYIVTSYFVRLRGLANGLCMSGSALGSIVLPPFLRYLLETYGYRGAILIMGGITFHVFVAAIFFQPVEEHMKREPIDPEEEDDYPLQLEDDLTYETYEDFSENSPEPEKMTSSPFSNNRMSQRSLTQKNEKSLSNLQKLDEEGDNQHDGVKPIIVVSGETSPSALSNGSPKMSAEDGSETPSKLDGLQLNSGFGRSVSAAVVQNVNKDIVPIERRRKVSMPIGKNVMRNSSRSTLSNMKSNPSLALGSVPEGRRYQLGSGDFSSKRTISYVRSPKRSPSTSSFQYMSTPFHGSTLSAFNQPEEFASQLTLQSIKESFSPITTCCGLRKVKQDQSKSPTDKHEKNKFFDLSLLKDPIYLVILISNITNAISYTNFIILLPSYAKTMGFDKSLGAYLLSIVSALDLVGRIGGSALSDMGLIPKTWYFVGGLFFSGASLAALPLASSYGFISCFCSVFGLASGVYVGVTAIIMAELLGMERLTSTYGISLFVNGFFQLIGPPLIGVWYEKSESYSVIFSTLGLVTVWGAAIWCIMPYLQRRKALKELEEAKEAEKSNKGPMKV